MAIVYLCLGSNKFDKVSYIQQATNLLTCRDLIKIIRTSMIYETEPWGKKEQNWFVNAVIEAKTSLSPKELLNLTQSIEIQLGRDRKKEEHWGERTIDIDILFYDNLIMNEKDLKIPHPYLHERAFALVPLLELIPDYVHPVLEKTMLELHEGLENPEDVYLYGTRIHD